MYTEILYDVADSIATITLNRPDKLNAFTDQMRSELIEVFDAVDADDAVRSVIVTSAGSVTGDSQEPPKDVTRITSGPEHQADRCCCLDSVKAGARRSVTTWLRHRQYGKANQASRRNDIMSTLCNERIETGDVIELDRDGELISALVLLATEDALILDACDDTTPFVLRRIDLVEYRLFQPEAA